MAEHFLCELTDLADPGSKGFVCAGQKLFAVRRGAKVYVYHNTCPHLGIPLEWVEDQFLDFSQSMIQCANHSALFVIENGKCVAGPCSGQKLHAIGNRIAAGKVFIQLDTQ